MRARLRYANGPLVRSLRAADFAALLARPMRAVANAEPLAGPFPLIVIGLGLYYESPVTFAALAEYHAGTGLVVATTPLAGTHVALVKVDGQDIETQARDLEFVIARARQLDFVDAFVSLDSGIQYPHPSGQPRASPYYDPLALRVPWLHASAPRNDPPAGEATSLFDEAVHSDRYWLRAPALGHADFTSYALVEKRGAADNYWAPATPARAAGHRAVAEYVRHFFNAHMNGSDVSVALLDQALRQPPADLELTLEFRPATPAPIGYDERVRKLIDGEADDAIAALRSLAATSPDHWLLAGNTFGRLWVSMLFTWNLAEQALPLVEFAVERYPDSANARAMVGETQAVLGNVSAAIAAYEQVLAKTPGDNNAAARLEALRNQR